MRKTVKKFLIVVFIIATLSMVFTEMAIGQVGTNTIGTATFKPFGISGSDYIYDVSAVVTRYTFLGCVKDSLNASSNEIFPPATFYHVESGIALTSAFISNQQYAYSSNLNLLSNTNVYHVQGSALIFIDSSRIPLGFHNLYCFYHY